MGRRCAAAREGGLYTVVEGEALVVDLVVVATVKRYHIQIVTVDIQCHGHTTVNRYVGVALVLNHHIAADDVLLGEHRIV